MITKELWKEFKQNFNSQTPYGKYKYTHSEITQVLLLSIFLSPVAIVLDILFFPIEVIYLICLKMIERIRWK